MPWGFALLLNCYKKKVISIFQLVRRFALDMADPRAPFIGLALPAYVDDDIDAPLQHWRLE